MNITLDTLVKWVAVDGSSTHGGTGTWTRGRWRKARTPLAPCRRGLHIVSISQSPPWVTPRVGLVEVRGERIDAADKTVVAEARITDWLPWDRHAMQLWAADCAEHVLPTWETAHPDDDRPRRAIEAARRYVRGEGSREATVNASPAAWAAARTADPTALPAVHAAESAAYAADAAVCGADYDEDYAVYATASAVGSAVCAVYATASAVGSAVCAVSGPASPVFRVCAAERLWQAERLLAYLKGEA